MLTGEAADERAAAPRHVRLGRRRQVDADRPAPLRLEAGHGRPARARRGDERAPRRRLRQPRAAHRRPPRGARAGDHDRRRVPVVRHPDAPLPARGRAGARPVHAQHGHGRLDRRRRRRPPRRAQGRDRADAAAHVHRRDARHPPHRLRREQDGPRRLRRGALPRDRARAATSSREQLGVRDEIAIPIAALPGDNVVEPSERMPWWDGGTFLERLETIEIAGDRDAAHRRFPVQWVIRPMSRRAPRLPRLRGPGRGRRVARRRRASSSSPPASARPSRRSRRTTAPLDVAVQGQSVVVRLADDVDVARGDMLCDPADPPVAARELEAIVCWMSERPVADGRAARRQADDALVARDPRRGDRRRSTSTRSSRCRRTASRSTTSRGSGSASPGPLLVDPYAVNRQTGAFVLVDEATNETVGAGMVLAARLRA